MIIYSQINYTSSMLLQCFYCKQPLDVSGSFFCPSRFLFLLLLFVTPVIKHRINSTRSNGDSKLDSLQHMPIEHHPSQLSTTSSVQNAYKNYIQHPTINRLESTCQSPFRSGIDTASTVVRARELPDYTV